jgi:hypothetical protein
MAEGSSVALQTSTSKKSPPTQQEIEQHYFELFRKAYPLPAGAVDYGDKPDIMITGPRVIGIEITNLYLVDGSDPSSEQVQERRRREAVSRGQEIYEDAGGSNFQLSFSFNKRHPIQDVEAVARKLSDLAQRVEAQENGRIRKSAFSDIPELEFAYLYARELVYPDDYADPDFPNGQPDPSEGFGAFATYRNRREVHALRVGLYRPLSFPAKWNIGQGHDFGLMSQARLTEIVRLKEQKVKKYRPCDAYWLLVIVDFMSAAQEQEIRVDGLRISSAVFEKIIVYKPNFDHILDVTVI